MLPVRTLWLSPLSKYYESFFETNVIIDVLKKLNAIEKDKSSWIYFNSFLDSASVSCSQKTPENL